MRLIHSADWQLGKPFGRFPQEVRTALGEARFDAIDRIGALARGSCPSTWCNFRCATGPHRSGGLGCNL